MHLVILQLIINYAAIPGLRAFSVPLQMCFQLVLILVHNSILLYLQNWSCKLFNDTCTTICTCTIYTVE